MDKKVIIHFQTYDPRLYAILSKIKDKQALTPRKSTDYFMDICEAIINQQLSDKAGATIYKRFIALFPKQRITPHALLMMPQEKMRAVGPSWSKVRFLTSFAQYVVEGNISLEALEALPDNEVIDELTKVKGIGPWTAEMFLMFSLGRPDVFSYGDLGLKRAIQRIYGFKNEPSRDEMKKVVDVWTPYKTYAAKILWRSLEMPDILE